MEPKRKVGRPITRVAKSTGNTSQAGTKENETRATFIINEALLSKVKGMAYWDRIDIKKVVNDALQVAVAEYESKNGSIQPIPEH